MCELVSGLKDVEVAGCAANSVHVLRRFAEFLPHCVVLSTPVRDCGRLELLGALRELNGACFLVDVTNRVTARLGHRSGERGRFLRDSLEVARVAAVVRALKDDDT